MPPINFLSHSSLVSLPPCSFSNTPAGSPLSIWTLAVSPALNTLPPDTHMVCSHVRWLVETHLTALFKIMVLLGASLVVQWLRIHLPMQGTRVQVTVREDPTCRWATKPMHHNYWACALEPGRQNNWACAPQLLKPMRLEPVLHNKTNHRNEKPEHCIEEQPLLAATRESPRAATKTQHSQK